MSALFDRIDRLRDDAVLATLAAAYLAAMVVEGLLARRRAR